MVIVIVLVMVLVVVMETVLVIPKVALLVRTRKTLDFLGHDPSA